MIFIKRKLYWFLFDLKQNSSVSLCLLGNNKFLHIQLHQKGNYLSINTQVLLKGICNWSKFYNIVTMTVCIFITNRTKLPFRYDQLYVSNITIKYCYINVFIIYIIISDRIQDSLWNKSFVWIDYIEFRTRLTQI